MSALTFKDIKVEKCFDENNNKIRCPFYYKIGCTNYCSISHTVPLKNKKPLDCPLNLNVFIIKGVNYGN